MGKRVKNMKKWDIFQEDPWESGHESEPSMPKAAEQDEVSGSII